MALTFPPSPNVGDTYLSYIWDGTKWGVQAGVGGVAGVSSFNTRVGAVVLALGDVTSATGSGSTAQASLGLATVAASGAYADLSGAPSLASYAPIAAPVFTGDARAVTPAVGDNDTSIATTAFVAAAVQPVANNVGRNLLHNPLFNVAQRGAGPFTTNSTYTLDRWVLGLTLDTVSVARLNTIDADKAGIGDEAAVNYLQNSFTGNAGASAGNYIEHRIEGVRRLSGKTVTVSFWAVGTGPKLGVNMYQLFGSGGSPSTYVQALATGAAISVGGSWARYTVTIPIPSTAGKTLGSNGDDYTILRFYCSAGATQTQQAGNIGVQSGTINLWGVQLEIGSTATPLEKPDPQQDLARCQRFYQTVQPFVQGYAVSNTVGVGATLAVVMRASPTLSMINNACTGVGAVALGGNGTFVFANATASGTGAYTINASIGASADL